MSQTKEQSVKSSYTVVYELQNKEWVALGNGGWSEVHLCSDVEDGTFRILAWSVETQEVLLNASVTEQCVYKGSKKQNFHSFQSENGKYGLGFHKSGDALKQADEFLKTVAQVIRQLSDQAGMSNVKTGTVQASLVKDGFIEKKDFKPLQALKILPPKPGKGVGADNQILEPQEVKHERHVYFDQKSGRFKGNFPPTFEAELKKQFGVKPSQLPCSKVPGYKSGIPTLLLDLKELIKKHGGFQQVGIFRLAPDGHLNDDLKKRIDTGDKKWKENENASNINVCANLLKIWFRELPTPILNQVPNALIEKSQDVKAVATAVQNEFAEPTQSLLLWLWDLCVEVAAYKSENKMTPQNLAIVIGPNLFNTKTFQNPMAAMTFSGKVVVFFQRGIEWRQEVAKRKKK